ncbi:MAG: alpha/beta fold hydrolase [Phycisphaeraceae bacterium]|nr:alpha/beta fold hydrolase [Phycisphaeraceae bacterium]
MSLSSRTRHLLLGVSLLIAWTVVLVIGTLLAAEAMRVRSMAPLARWHQEAPRSEFTARLARKGMSFDDYLRLEDEVFAELDGYYLDSAEAQRTSPVIRFVKGGLGDPATFSPNWNRTQILIPNGPAVGGALLLHGLTDSPYSMRSTAEELTDAGFLSICLRYPGHGTVPAGILKADWQDWYEAVKIAWRGLEERVPAGTPLVLVGYSTGGALAVLLTLELLEKGERAPDQLILFSPAIGITPLAAFSNVHRLYSWMPFYNKARWLSVEPEYDPFKYNSFPQHAGAQSWALTGAVTTAIDRAVSSGVIARVPPILSFQSLVDSTIVARDLITRLYDRLPDNGSEIVCFDVNRGHQLDGLLSRSVPDIERLLRDPSLPYRFTLITNVNPGSRELEEVDHRRGQGELERRPLDAQWPLQVFSLAHVAIPFPPEDPLYGDGRVPSLTPRLHLGSLSMRGERGALAVSADDLMRLRHNPFHATMMARVREAIAAQAAGGK